MNDPTTATTTADPPVDPADRAIADVTTASKIMIVDDEPVNIKVAKRYLETGGYKNFAFTSDATQALGLIDRERPDVLLLDIMMPEVSGLAILESLRRTPHGRHLPVIVLTASTDAQTRHTALNLGATDFLAKPVDGSELIPRVRNALVVKAYHDYLADQASLLERRVQERTRELEQSRLDLLQCLARAAEYRDNETGKHVLRVGRYAGIIARKLGLDGPMCLLIAQAAPLHDVGKIGIPDSILLKPGKLTPDEMDVMRTHSEMGRAVFERVPEEDWSAFREHAQIGASILGDARSSLLEMAARIAYTHHERWDGAGYPEGLSGNEIPIEGRITAVADVFDALSSSRPYKSAMPVEQCFEIIDEGSGSQFDPAVAGAFLSSREEILAVYDELMDQVTVAPVGAAAEE